MSRRTAYTLGKLYEVHNGLSKASKFFGSGYPFIAFKDVFNNYFIPEVPSGLVQSTQKEQDSYSVKRGDILITRTSETHDELGMSSVALIDYPHATYNGFTKRLRPITDLVHPEFIGYYLRAPFFRSGFQQFSSMTTRASLKNEELLNMQVLLPSMEEQKRLASILMAYDNLIENNRRQIALLEEAAQRLYREWFVDLRFPEHENTEMSEGLPSGWAEKSLAEIADVVMGQSPKSEYYNDAGEGLPFHQGVSSYGLRFVRDETYTTSVTRIGKAGSILFSVRAPVGRLNYTKNEIVLGRGLAAMNHRQGLQSYLYYMLKERFFKEDMIGNGSIFASISKGDLLAQKFVVPDSALAERFDLLCQPIDRQIARCDDAIKAATEARDRLLPKLMSGEVEV